MKPHTQDTKRFALAVICTLLAGCANFPLQSPAPAPEQHGQSPPDDPGPSSDVARQAETERLQALEREVDRLRADLARAEDALIAVESKLRTGHSRAAAVAALAEAQIRLNRASLNAPWRSEMISAARSKLAIAQKHIDEGYFGTAVFFVYRANRMVEDLRHEADIVDNSTHAMFINRPKVNLRSRPSTSAAILKVLIKGTPVMREKQEEEWVLVRTLTGAVGWVHRSLLTSKARYKA